MSATTCACGEQLFAVPGVYGAYLIRAGVIDEQARKAFTQGQCHAFAKALHEETGWPIVALVAAVDWACNSDVERTVDAETQTMSYSGLNDFGEHLMVRHPDGHLVDIAGRHTAAEMFEDHGHREPPRHPLWGVCREDDSEVIEEGDDPMDSSLFDWDARLVAVDPDSIDHLWGRPASLDAARTLVAPLLATLAETTDPAPGPA